MERRYTGLSGVVGGCVFACAAILACAWPSELQADDAESQMAQPDIGQSATKIGAIQTSTRLVKGEGRNGKWYIEVQVQNKNAEGRETAQLEEEVLRETFQPMARTESPVRTVAWKVREKVDVMPGEKVVVRHELPAWLGLQVAQSLKPVKEGEPYVARPMYQTRVMNAAAASHASSQPNRAPQRSAKYASMPVSNQMISGL